MLAAVPEEDAVSDERRRRTTNNNIDATNNDDDDPSNPLLRGVVFGRSVRSTFASIHVARLPDDKDDDDDEDEEEPVLIRVQFVEEAIALRSYFRRFCKLGDLLQLYSGKWQRLIADDSINITEWQAPRWVVHVESVCLAQQTVRVVERHYWTMPQCQRWQRNYLPITVPIVQKKKGTKQHNDDDDEHRSNLENASGGTPPPLWMDRPSSENVHTTSRCSHHHHGSGLAKRMQGQYIANFLLHMIAQRIIDKGNNNSNCYSTKDDDDDVPLPDPSQWAQTNVMDIKQHAHSVLLQAAVKFLNKNNAAGGGGVVDAAGGSGHVSMALAMVGVRSTVVDPREHVGKLPKRDRKIYRNALKNSRHRSCRQQQLSSSTLSAIRTNGDTAALEEEEDDIKMKGKTTESCSASGSSPALYCPPIDAAASVVPYDSLRAWFGPPPAGVDTSFRHPDQTSVSVLDVDQLKKRTCSAIVALHPDEATDAIVDLAVQLRIPFVIVPCCVFFRLFSHRRKPTNSSEPVSTYQDLLEYLMAKHESIQRTTLPFEGANTILWSYF